MYRAAFLFFWNQNLLTYYSKILKSLPIFEIFAILCLENIFYAILTLNEILESFACSSEIVCRQSFQ